MQSVPLAAKAECTDGRCGDSVGVIVDRTSRTLTHFLVRDAATKESVERLVPRDRVDASEESTLRLSCTLAELAEMPPLMEPEYRQQDMPDDSSFYYFSPYQYGTSQVPTVPRYVHAETEHLPEGAVLLRDHLKVEATNGGIGKLDGIVIDDGGQLTHFYTQLNRHGSPELFLPLSTVTYADHEAVYLRLDKHQIESLPIMPSRHSRSSALPFEHVELAAKVFSTPEGAHEALAALRVTEKPIKIREAAVLVRDAEGKIRVEDASESGVVKSAAVGVAAGGLLAMLGPIGLVVGAVAGGAVGAAVGSRRDLGFPDAFLKRLEERLEAGHSALVVLVEHEWSGPGTERLSALDGVISQEKIVDTLVQDMLAEQSVQTQPV